MQSKFGDTRGKCIPSPPLVKRAKAVTLITNSVLTVDVLYSTGWKVMTYVYSPYCT